MTTDHLYLVPTDIQPARPEPYWRTQLHLPSHHADNRGMLAALWRRLITRVFKARWRLTIEISIDADLDEPDRDSAVTALESALYALDAVWVLLRAEPGATPPWWPVAWARRPVAYLDHGAVPIIDEDGSTVWSCVGTVVVAFTVDVDEASWPSDRYLVGLAASPPPGPACLHRQPGLGHPTPTGPPTPPGSLAPGPGARGSGAGLPDRVSRRPANSPDPSRSTRRRWGLWPRRRLFSSLDPSPVSAGGRVRRAVPTADNDSPGPWRIPAAEAGRWSAVGTQLTQLTQPVWRKPATQLAP